MKKCLFITATVLVFALCHNYAQAQIRKIPAEVTDNFAAMYPGAGSVQWKDRLTGFTASFNLNNVDYLAAFNNKGEWESTEHQIDEEELPDAVNDGLDKSKYSDWDIIKVDLIELPGDEVQYRITVGKGDIKKRNLYFSPKGRLLKDKLTL